MPAMWLMDTPEVRKLQEEETAKHFPEPATRKQLKTTVGDRVEVIYRHPKKIESGTGRAVALSPDGYYLTAYHVVDEPPFFLVEGFPAPTPKSGPVQTADADLKHYAGRIIWHDPDLDLALVKFDRPAARHFEKMRRQVKTGELVYTADNGGWTTYPLSGKPDEVIKWSDILDGMVGNGAFFSAGKVLASKRGQDDAGSAAHCLTLVARGGMSGGPLVTLDDELCGILVQGSVGPRLFRWPRTLSSAPRTYASMIEPEFILEKIRADRAVGPSGPGPADG